MGRLIEILLLLGIAGVCGLIASGLMGAKRMNFVVLIILGFIGAFVGRFIAGFFHLPYILTIHLAGEAFPILWSVIGGVIVVAIFTMINQH